jgi:bifunctional non-homologous end joining protein LigD
VTEAISVGSHAIEITHGGRVLFPDDGITKAEVVEHYARVAPFALPHLRGRPVSMQRVRDNIYAQVFYQKDAPPHFPDWVHRVTVPKSGGTVTHAICDDAASLVYLANQGCITPHVWLSRVPDLHLPDRLIIDLDPGDGGVADARFAAKLAREVLDEAGLAPFLMATGSRGYHVVVPIKSHTDFEDVRAVAFGLAQQMATRAPDRLTTEFYKEKRGGRLFLDCNRNELESVAPDEFNVRTISARLSASPDPWHGFARRAHSLDTTKRWLARLQTS